MSAIVLPPSTLTLTQWAQQHLTALYQATDEATLDAAYAAFLAPDASITVNGTRLSGDAYKAQLLLPSRGAQVAYSGAVEVPEDAGRPNQAGSVGLFLHAAIDEQFLVLGAPATSTVTASYNLSITQATFPDDQQTPSTPFDGRRVSVLTQVSVDKSNSVPVIPPVKIGSEDVSNGGINQPQQP